MGLVSLIGGVVGAIVWMSGMYHETKAARVATEQCVEVFKDVKVEVIDHRTRIISLEEWRAVMRSREMDADTDLEDKQA